MKNYGQTWWGREWLKALSHIDYSNRLPRGRNYANKGAVRNIDITGNTIQAKVQGTRSSPYKVKLSVPEFSGKEKAAFTEAIMANPLLLSKLLNRQLPAQLNLLAERLKIKIFPQRWDDLKMSCSCPDWAVPCKHLAAVINLVANEIDRNPFVIFKLHTYDIIQELKKQGLTELKEEVVIPAVKDFFSDKKKEAGDGVNQAIVEDIDFSEMEDLREPLLSLLSEKPLFHSRDFKSALDKVYRKMSKKVSSKSAGTGDETDNGINYEKFTHAQLSLSKGVFFAGCRLQSGDESITADTVEKLTAFLAGIPAKYLDRLSPDLVLLYFTWLFARKLIEKSAFIPQLVQLSDGTFAIRYIPAQSNEKVKEIFNSLTGSCSPGMVISEKENRLLKPEEQLNSLITAIIMEAMTENDFVSLFGSDPVTELFSSPVSHSFVSMGEKEIPSAIQRWLDKLYLTRQNHVPVLEINTLADSDRFSVNVLVEDSRQPFKAPLPLKDIISMPEFGEGKMEIMRSLDLLTHTFPALEIAIASSGKQLPVFDPEEFAMQLFNAIPAIKLYGIRVILPKELKNLVRPKTTVSLSSGTSSGSRSFLRLDKIIQFRWKIALGETILDADEFLKLVQGLSGIVKLKQQYVHLDPVDLKALMESLAKQEKLSRHQLLQAAITGEYNGQKITMDDNTRQLIDSLLQIGKMEVPAGIQASLRPYQERGFSWLYKNMQLGFGSIIADDMGLGKTLQVIAMLQQIKDEGGFEKQKALVVVPTTLLTNWQKELEKFAPGLSYAIYHGNNRQLDLHSDIVITSYGMARSDLEIFSKHKWKAIVIDEAQNIKNVAAAQTQAVKKLKADIRIAMSGTPVENRLSEYWSIFDFTFKGYLGSLKQFIGEYAAPIEMNRDRKILSHFLKVTSPFILRRLKTDKTIISDLPEKMEQDYHASLTKEQAAIYQNVLNHIMAEIVAVDETNPKNAIKRKGLVLTLIMALKQICNHPSQYLKKEDASPDLSGKASLFMNLIENILENNEKVLVFTQFREMGDILRKMIKVRLDMDAMFLHGGSTRKQRDEMVRRFQENPHEKIFILSIKAGGTGLNLTAASHVIHYDLWWNPAVENQATDRAYRIGQHKNVMVYRMITKGTFEEKINAMLKSKKELADLSISIGEQWVGNLSNRELRKVFARE